MVYNHDHRPLLINVIWEELAVAQLRLVAFDKM